MHTLTALTPHLAFVDGLDDFLRRYWIVGAVSLAVTLLATPICRAIAMKYRIVDRPDDFLKPHGRPIPYLGGVGIFCGWCAGLLTGYFTLEMTNQTLAVLLAGTCIMLLGLFDDLRVMSAKVKLAGNIAVAGLLIYAGIGNDSIRVITDLADIHFRSPGEVAVMYLYSVPISAFIIVGACNAANLIDGMDGLCSGVLGIISVGFLVLAAHPVLVHPDAVHSVASEQRIVFSLAMLGAAIGFLPFNRNPATIFMGDAGSMLLGLNAAVLILLFANAGVMRWFVGALIIFGLPIADMALTLVRRWRNEKPLMLGDRSHFYDQLRDRGLSVRQVVGISYGVTILFVIFGCLVIFVRTMYALAIYFGLVVAVTIVISKLRMVSLERPPSGSTTKTTDRGAA